MEKLLNAKQVGELLGVAQGTLYTWVYRGTDLPYIKFSGKRGPIRFQQKSVEKWIQTKEQQRRRKNFED